MKLIEIHDRIYTRGHTHKLSSSDLLNALGNLRVTTIVNLTSRVDEPLRAASGLVGVEYVCLPLVDNDKIDRHGVYTAVETIVNVVESNHGVLVHCISGRNRTGLVVGIAVCRLTGLEPTEVLARLRERRPGLLTNETFQEYLLSGAWRS